MERRNKGEDYVQQYPKFQKWIKQCVQCQSRGYDPNMPDTIGHGLYSYKNQEWYSNTWISRYLKKYFKPLELNECGLCEVCAVPSR